MFSIMRPGRLAITAVACAAAGAGASAIATAGAASGGHSSTGRHARHGASAAHHGRLGRLARRTVHGDFVVHTRNGFVTATIDRGVVDSVSGDQLSLTEGTRAAQYRSETLTIPAGARIRDDRQPVSLSSLQAGQRVLVLSLPKRTVVIARAAGSGPNR